MTPLVATLKVRVEEAQREQLEEEAARQGVKPATLLRIYLRDGLARDRAELGESRRV